MTPADSHTFTAAILHYIIGILGISMLFANTYTTLLYQVDQRTRKLLPIGSPQERTLHIASNINYNHQAAMDHCCPPPAGRTGTNRPQNTTANASNASQAGNMQEVSDPRITAAIRQTAHRRMRPSTQTAPAGPSQGLTQQELMQRRMAALSVGTSTSITTSQQQQPTGTNWKSCPYACWYTSTASPYTKADTTSEHNIVCE